MIICEVNKNHLNVRTRELLTAGSRNVNSVEFRFNGEWDGLTKTATFKTAKKSVSIKLSSDICVIPWEVLADTGEFLAVGVLGMTGETVVLPTVWGVLGKVVDAAHLGEDEQEPTPDVYQQILNEIASIEKPSWTDVTNKPFESLGDGLEVEDGVLSVIGGGGSTVKNAVLYTEQTLTEEQQAQARENIGAIGSPQSATVGDVLTVEEVDENGKPTKWKALPAAAEQVQADWGENDETAASYVKNRPGGYTVKQKQKTTVTVSSGEQNGDDFTAFPPFEVGDTVSITVNGTEYSLVARRPDDASDGLNIALIGDDPNAETKEYGWSFFRYYIDSDDNTITMFINATDADMTVEFYAVDAVEEDVPVKFDPKYIPDVEIDLKNIPDMYYTANEEANIAGYTIENVNYKGNHDEVYPFKLGQVWNATGRNINYTNLEVNQADDGTLYIGDLNKSSIPFFVSTTSGGANSAWLSNSNPGSMNLVGVSGTMLGDVVHKIPKQYMPEDVAYTSQIPSTAIMELTASNNSFRESIVIDSTYSSAFVVVIGEDLSKPIKLRYLNIFYRNNMYITTIISSRTGVEIKNNEIPNKMLLYISEDMQAYCLNPIITTTEALDIIIPSSTSGSTKKFKISVDDNGTISATEVTE